jgi:hypothetical protein
MSLDTLLETERNQSRKLSGRIPEFDEAASAHFRSKLAELLSGFGFNIRFA